MKQVPIQNIQDNDMLLGGKLATRHFGKLLIFPGAIHTGVLFKWDYFLGENKLNKKSMWSLLKAGDKNLKSTKYANWGTVIDLLWPLMITITLSNYQWYKTY